MRRFNIILYTVFTAFSCEPLAAQVTQVNTNNGVIGGPITTTGTIGLATGAAVGNLGFTPLNKAGDTMTGIFALMPSGTQTGSGGTPLFKETETEAFTAGSSFANAIVVSMTRTGGTGQREAMHVEMDSSASSAGFFNVGGTFIGHQYSGSAGNSFGLNGVGWTDSGAATSSEIVGGEFNTQIQNTSVVRKVGIQVVDTALSTGIGTTFDAGVLIASQPGGHGYSVGLKFGAGQQSSGSDLGIQGGGTVIGLAASSLSLRAGLDFSGGVFSQFAIATPGFMVDGSGDLLPRGLESHAG